MRTLCGLLYDAFSPQIVSRPSTSNLLYTAPNESRDWRFQSINQEIHVRGIQPEHPRHGRRSVRSAISCLVLTDHRHRYFSYGAAVQPSIWSVFRLSHKVLAEAEGPNDGLVSVASSRWGGDQGYKGTLVGVSHLDLINWTNRLKWVAGEMMGYPRKFNAIAFYLDIAGESSCLSDVFECLQGLS